MTFLLKIGVCLCAKALCPETDFVKIFGSFILMWNKIAHIGYRPKNSLYFQKSAPTFNTDNCCALYKPGAFITVDEQLFPDKAKCPFTQYMASKPDKFGPKYWLAVDKESKYVINGFAYVEKDEMRYSTECVFDGVVMQFMRPYLCKGRNVTTDSYFTSVKLANQLKEKQNKSFGNSKQN